MKRIFCILSLATLVLTACERKGQYDPSYADEYIHLDATEDSGYTKALLGRNDLTQNGTSFQTYDYVSNYTGSISGHTNGEQFQYFSNSLTYKSDATPWTWLFGNVASPTSYRWTRTGTHRFFGWMLADGHDASNLNTSSFFSTYSTNFNESTGVHTASLGSSITVDSPQYDFLYSDIVNVAVADGIPDRVNLPMKHLFGAIGLSISNNSDLDVIVYEVSFRNFPNTNSVTLDYGDLSGNVSLNYPEPTASGSAYLPNKLSSPITLYNRHHATLADKTYDAITGTELTGDSDPSYYLAWPMLKSTLEPTGTTYDADGNPVYSASAPLIAIDCKVGAQARKTLTIKFPSISDSPSFIAAGRKTNLALQFLNKQIGLSFTIKDWQFEKYPMSYESDAISATQLKFTLNTYIYGGTERFNGANHAVVKLTSSSTAGSYIATGSFKVFTPVNATLTVGLGGNADDFIVSLQSGDEVFGGTESITINPSRNGGKITLTIRPNGTPAHGSRCFLHFGVRNNGRDSSADSEINRDGFIVEFP